MSNKKGSAFVFIYVIIFLGFLLGLYIVYHQTLSVYIAPTAEDVLQPDAYNQARIDKFLNFWGWFLYLIILVPLLFLVTTSIRTDRR